MGNNCTCINSPKEPEISSVLESNSNLLDEETERQLKSKRAPKTREHSVLNSLKERISLETNNNVIVNEISKEDFDKIVGSFPNVDPILSTTLSQITNIEEESEKNSKLEKIPPVHLSNKVTDEEEYFEGYINKKGEIEGFGTLITQTGIYYKGNFKNNVFDGKGLFINPSGEYYIGDWVKGESKGKGKLILKDGTIYEGDFDSNMKNGFGKETYPDGSVYEGIFQNNIKEKKGTITYKDGSVYKGDIQKGEISGKGEYTWNDGRKYEGEFKNGKLTGKGKNIMRDGSTYEGEYVDNIKSGNGIYSWKNGKRYTGTWNNNQPEGKGILEIDGKHFDVLFKEGKIEKVKSTN